MSTNIEIEKMYKSIFNLQIDIWINISEKACEALKLIIDERLPGSENISLSDDYKKVIRRISPDMRINKYKIHC